MQHDTLTPTENTFSPASKGAARLAVALVAVLLFVGLSAQAAEAKKGDGGAPGPHVTEIRFLGALEGDQSEIVQVPTGEWVTIGQAWKETTAEKLDHFMSTVIVEVERNGVPHDFSTDIRTDVPDEDWPGGQSSEVSYGVVVKPGPPHRPEVWTMRWTLTEDRVLFAGFPPFPAGSVLEASRTIVRTPRGQFPSDAYPCPNGQHPCVDG